MPVALITHPDCFDHDTGPHHPERPARLRAVLAALESPEFQSLLREAAPEAPEAAIRGVHNDAYVDAMFALNPGPDEIIHLDADTVASAGTLRAARRAAGGAMRGVDAVLEGWARCAFVAVRPPGHHAEQGRAMGFCLFGNAAIAANHARAHGLRRIAVADFDVHHGNGTQAMFENDPDFFYASSHQFPCYPGSGRPSDHGIAGNIVNAPLPPESGSTEFRAAWRDTLIPALDGFAPELLIVSAGFDAHKDDPLAELNVETEDFAWLTSALMDVAERHCGGRIVSLLEGGYDLRALAAGTAAHVRALMRV
ncbi:MAG: histone deacetylase family protein [Acidiphilium sp.]|nr:histone deacetylase family protein [Acidiphilium sp.]MDD4935678.1 histone deacetylase family protein [Acidiphilium sp.]